MSYERQRAMLRIIQEALANVFRHAQATQVKVAMVATDAHFKLQVTDNGRGMPSQAGEIRPEGDFIRCRNSGHEGQVAANRRHAGNSSQRQVAEVPRCVQ